MSKGVWNTDSLKRFLHLFHRALVEWHHDKAPRLSAALAFYMILSLSPILVIVVLIAGLVFGIETTQTFLVQNIREFMGPQAAEIIPQVFSRSLRPLTGFLATLFSLIALFWGASTVFTYLRDSFNTIWHVTPHAGRFGIPGFIRHRALAFIMIAGSGALLVCSLVGTTAITAVAEFLKGFIPIPVILLQLADFVVSIGTTTMIFSVVFMVLPSVRQRWTDVLPGSFMTAVLFTVGKLLIGFYFVTTTVASAFGAAGSVVVFLIWIYFGAQIFYYGAEFNKVFTRTFGSARHEHLKKETAKGAVRMRQ